MLTILFRSGRVYNFARVPVWMYKELVTASSPGAYFNRYIRSNSPPRPRTRIVKQKGPGVCPLTLKSHPEMLA